MENNEYTSDYNSALMQIQRLHLEWSMCNRAHQAGNFKKWFFSLNTIWVELAVDAQLIERKKKDNEWTDKTKKYIEEMWDALKSNDRSRQYDVLMEYDIHLRLLAEEAGKGSKRTVGYERMM